MTAPLNPGDSSVGHGGEKPETLGVTVTASVLHRLTPLLAKRSNSFLGGGRHLWGWRVEPCAEGGVLVIATNGTAAGVIHDPEGRATKPATILATKGLRKAVAPPPLRRVFYPGDYDDIALPDDFQPGNVYAHSLFVCIYDKASAAASEDADPGDEHYSLYTESAEEGSIWSGGYRLVPEYVDWRRMFNGWTCGATTPSNQRLSADLFAAFRNISREPLDLAMPESENSPVMIRCKAQPDFVGMIMRGRMSLDPPEPAAVPSWMAPFSAEALPHG